jgi:hypothetical protein
MRQVFFSDLKELTSPPHKFILKLLCFKQTALWDSIQAERLSPSYAKAPLRRGAAREAQGEWGLAAEAYNQAAKLASLSINAALPSSSLVTDDSMSPLSPSSPGGSSTKGDGGSMPQHPDMSIVKAAAAARNRCLAKLRDPRDERL